MKEDVVGPMFLVEVKSVTVLQSCQYKTHSPFLMDDEACAGLTQSHILKQT